MYIIQQTEYHYNEKLTKMLLLYLKILDTEIYINFTLNSKIYRT